MPFQVQNWIQVPSRLSLTLSTMRLVGGVSSTTLPVPRSKMGDIADSFCLWHFEIKGRVCGTGWDCCFGDRNGMALRPLVVRLKLVLAHYEASFHVAGSPRLRMVPDVPVGWAT